MVFNNRTATTARLETAPAFPSQGLQLVVISSSSDNPFWCHQVITACISAMSPGAGCPLMPHRLGQLFLSHWWVGKRCPCVGASISREQQRSRDPSHGDGGDSFWRTEGSYPATKRQLSPLGKKGFVGACVTAMQSGELRWCLP